MSSSLTSLHAREILDSRGNPTVEVELTTPNCRARRAVPSGASTGAHEAVELRDGGTRYGGLGVTNAVRNVNDLLAPALRGMDVRDQSALDARMRELDGTANKGKLGANAILGVSLAAADAAAQEAGVPLYSHLGDLAGTPTTTLPVPMMNIINGGKHADNGLDIQECMIAPIDFPNFREALRAGAEIFHTLKKLLKKAGYSTNVGDEGGFAPNVQTTEEALDTIVAAIDAAGYTGRVHLALDAASTEFYDAATQTYTLAGKSLTAAEMVVWYETLLARYPIYSLEDGLAEDDWAGWAALTRTLGDTVQLVGDDIFVTNPERIGRGIAEHSANAVLVKLNQIGTLTETIEAVRMATEAGWGTIASHRSGETEDSTIADLAVGLCMRQIKTGSLSRSDRLAKYNELLRIEEGLGKKAGYAGKGVL